MTDKEKELQRIRRKASGNAVTKKYEKTINGFLMRLYRNMQSRVSGVQKLKHHLYQDKPLLKRDKFYKWSRDNEVFLKLFHQWEESNYDRKLTPSIDRVNPKKGYILSNMEWVTHSENSRRGGRYKPSEDIVRPYMKV